MKVMVVGAKPNSLGEALCISLAQRGYTPVPAGVAGEEVYLDIVRQEWHAMRAVLDSVRPVDVLCTVGVNYASMGIRDLEGWYGEHFHVNCVGPMKLLDTFQSWCEEPRNRQRSTSNHAVVVSSNSAHVPRTQSAAYCASKAALSMAVRCKAREWARQDSSVIAYGYEPGLLAGTPMTEETRGRVGGDVPLHRMPGIGPEGLSVARLASMMVDNLKGGRELNGCMFRVDAGEL